VKILLPTVILVAAIGATSVRAFELCDVEGKSGELYSSLKRLDDVSDGKRLPELDAELNSMLASHEQGRTSDAIVHRVFQRFATGEVSLEPRLRDWIAAYPGSHAARLALAYHYTGRGRAARGGKDAKETSREQLAEAERYYRRALNAYDEADALGKRPTLSIAQRIYMAGSVAALGLDATRLYREAIRKYPDTLQVRIRYIVVSRPDVGGNVKQLESIIDDAATLPAADRRYIEYLVYQELGAVYWCSEREGCDDKPGTTRAGQNAKQVVGYLERSIPLCPGLDGALERLLTYQGEMRDYSGLIGTATRMIQRKPRHVRAFSTRAMAYARTGRDKESVEDYERAVQLGNYAALKELAAFYERGSGVPKDAAKAIDFYLIADMHDVEGARREAERLSKSTGIALQ
jgi:tetratricopeptide (TPR) repeat protein